MTSGQRRFVLAAGAARVTSEGGPVALVLAGAENGTDPRFVATLLAAWTLPQIVVGPLTGGLLDRSANRARWCATATAVAGIGLLALIESLGGSAPVAVTLVLLQAVTQPVVNGGISAVASAAPGARLDRWDGLSYNVAGVGGPAVVAVAGATLDARAAAASIAVVALIAAALLPGALPSATVEADPEGEHLLSGIRRAIGVMMLHPVLRTSTIVSTLGMVGIGGLSLATVSAVEDAGRRPAAAAQLLTVLAVGALGGSWIWTRRSDIVRPDRLAVACVLVTGAALGAAAWSSAWLFRVACFAAAGLVDGPLLLATLVARSRHSSVRDRAAVFTIGASAKIAASAVGAVAVGSVVVAGPSTAGLWLVAAIHLAAGTLGAMLHRGTGAAHDERAGRGTDQLG